MTAEQHAADDRPNGGEQAALPRYKYDGGSLSRSRRRLRGFRAVTVHLHPFGGGPCEHRYAYTLNGGSRILEAAMREKAPPDARGES